MSSGFYYCFEGKRLLLDLGNGVRALPLGTLSIAFLSVEWDSLASLSHETAPSNKLFVSSGLYEAVKRQLSSELWGLVMIPLLGTASFEQKRPDIRMFTPLLHEISQAFFRMKHFRSDMERLADQVFTDNGGNAALTPLQRFYLFQMSNRPLFTELRKQCEGVTAEQRIIGQGGRAVPSRAEVTPELAERLRRMPLEAHVFFCSSDPRTIIFMELQQMAAQGAVLRRCANCGGLFVPFSKTSRYCDRPVAGSQRRCRDLAAAGNYRQKLREDRVEQLYRKRGNTCRMRAKRGVCGEEAYRAWKRRADALREQVRSGELGYEEFEAQTRLPEL